MKKLIIAMIIFVVVGGAACFFLLRPESISQNSVTEDFTAHREAFETGDLRTDEKKAVAAVKSLLGGEIGNIYTQKYLDSDTLQAVKEMTDDIISAYRSCIECSQLLDENDRALCLAKLDNMTVNIGCPDEKYHSSSVVSGSLLESAVSVKSSAVSARRSLMR